MDTSSDSIWTVESYQSVVDLERTSEESNIEEEENVLNNSFIVFNEKQEDDEDRDYVPSTESEESDTDSELAELLSMKKIENVVVNKKQEEKNAKKMKKLESRFNVERGAYYYRQVWGVDQAKDEFGGRGKENQATSKKREASAEIPEPKRHHQ